MLGRSGEQNVEINVLTAVMFQWAGQLINKIKISKVIACMIVINAKQREQSWERDVNVGYGGNMNNNKTLIKQVIGHVPPGKGNFEESLEEGKGVTWQLAGNKRCSG